MIRLHGRALSERLMRPIGVAAVLEFGQLDIGRAHDRLALFDQLRLEGATEATALKAVGCSRATRYRWKRRLRKFDRHPKRWRYGDRGQRPGQMVQIDHMSVAIDAGFCVKESEAVCPVSKLCCRRA